MSAGTLVRSSAAQQCPDGTPAPCGPRAAAQARAAVPGTNSVAVLYFDNLSRDTSDAYLADGLTEEITSRLGDVRRLEVKSRSSVRPFRGDAASDLAAVGRRLRVRYLVEGSVRRAGERVRVSARLVRADNGFRVWGGDYDRSSTDLLALQEEIAREVAASIAGRLFPEERARLAARPTRNAEAYDHFLRGNYYLAFRSAGTAARAVAEYEAALRLDSSFSAALARVSLTYSLIHDWGWPGPAGLSPDSMVVRAAAAAQQAIRLDSTSADGWIAEAYALSAQHPRTYEGVLPAIERATVLDPRNAEAWHQYGYFLFIFGRSAESLVAFQRALSIEPGRAITCEHMARALLMVERRYDEARRWIDSATVLDPAQSYYFEVRSAVRLFQGDSAGARRDADESARLGAADYRFWGAVAQAMVAVRAGDTTGVPTLDARLLAAVGDPHDLKVTESILIAAVVALAGRRDAALAYLEQMKPNAGNWVMLLGPYFDPVRADSRFQRFAASIRPPGAAR